MALKKQPAKEATPRKTKSDQALDAYYAQLLPLGDEADAEEIESTVENEERPGTRITVVWKDIEHVTDNPFQPRSLIDEEALEDLKESFDEHGQAQAALGRPHPTRPGYIQLCSGHNRKEVVKRGANAGLGRPDAAQYIGKLLIDVRDLTDQQMLDIAYDENDKRSPLSVFDRANYWIKKRELATPEGEGLPSWEEFVKANKTKIAARQLRRLVEALELPKPLRTALAKINLGAADPTDPAAEKKFEPINEKHARAFLMLQDKEAKPKAANAKQNKLLGELQSNRLSGNEALRRAQQLRDGITPGAQGTESTGTTQTGSTGQTGAGGAKSPAAAKSVKSGAGSGASSTSTKPSEPKSTGDAILDKLQNNTRGLAEAAEMLESGKSTVKFLRAVEREIEAGELQWERLKKAVRRQ